MKVQWGQDRLAVKMALQHSWYLRILETEIMHFTPFDASSSALRAH